MAPLGVAFLTQPLIEIMPALSNITLKALSHCWKQRRKKGWQVFLKKNTQKTGKRCIIKAEKLQSTSDGYLHSKPRREIRVTIAESRDCLCTSNNSRMCRGGSQLLVLCSGKRHLSHLGRPTFTLNNFLAKKDL